MVNLFGDEVYDMGPALPGGREQCELFDAGVGGWMEAMNDWLRDHNRHAVEVGQDGTFTDDTRQRWSVMRAVERNPDSEWVVEEAWLPDALFYCKRVNLRFERTFPHGDFLASGRLFHAEWDDTAGEWVIEE